jgi:hypothetical protein
MLPISSGMTLRRFLLQNRADLYPAQVLLGHKDGRMKQRYAHLIEEHLRKFVKSVDRKATGHNKEHSKFKGVESLLSA